MRIAALHFNENSHKEQAETRDGQRRYSISFPKYKQGHHIVREIATPSTYSKYNTFSLLII